MTKFFATKAPNNLSGLLQSGISGLVIFIIILGLVLLGPTTWSVLSSRMTAPPSTHGIFILMSFTRPIKIIRLVKFLTTIFTHFGRLIDSTFSLLEPSDPLPHPLILIEELLQLFVRLPQLIDGLIKLQL